VKQSALKTNLTLSNSKLEIITGAPAADQKINRSVMARMKAPASHRLSLLLKKKRRCIYAAAAGQAINQCVMAHIINKAKNKMPVQKIRTGILFSKKLETRSERSMHIKNYTENYAASSSTMATIASTSRILTLAPLIRTFCATIGCDSFSISAASVCIWSRVK